MNVSQPCAQITSEYSNGCWEPIKKVLQDKCCANGKGVLLVQRYWSGNVKDKFILCSPVVNWDNNQAYWLGCIRFDDGDANKVYTNKDKRRDNLHFNVPDKLQLTWGFTYLTIGKEDTRNGSCTAVEVYELL